MVVHVNNSLSGRCFFLALRLTIVSLDSMLLAKQKGEAKKNQRLKALISTKAKKFVNESAT